MDSGGDRIAQLRQELAELRAEVERLKAEKGETQPREPRHKRPKLRVIEGGLGAAAIAWVHEHWRSAAISAAASTLAAGALSWNYQIGPEEVDVPESKPKPAITRRAAVPSPRPAVVASPTASPTAAQFHDRRPPTSMPKGTVPPAPASKRPTPSATPSETEPTRTPTPTASATLLPSLRLPELTLPPRLTTKVREQLPTLPIPTGRRCPQVKLGVTVTVCVPIRR